MSEPKEEPEPATEKRALEAARRAAEGFRPDLVPDTSEYAAWIDFALRLYRVLGRAKFELNFGLRPPRGRMEEICRDHFQRKISDQEAKSLLKAYAEQPIDLGMLTTYHEGIADQVDHYSNVLQRVVPKSYRSSPEDLRKQERYVDAQVRSLREKYPMDRRNLTTVGDFLEEVRVRSGRGLIVLGEFEAVSAHWLAQLVIERTVKSWRSCKATAERSRTDRRYAYAAGAADLLFQSSFPHLPAPQRILERLREEFILGRAELVRLGQGAPSPPSAAAASLPDSSTVTASDSAGRCEILVGEFTAAVAKAGHIFREVLKGDNGLDGEIEFKDHAGEATGRRVYVQLKSGDSHLRFRKKDQQEVFTVKNRRHLVYWQQHAYPVMLVVRQSSGRTRWMEISSYLNQNAVSPHVRSRERKLPSSPSRPLRRDVSAGDEQVGHETLTPGEHCQMAPPVPGMSVS